jgi:hypothetical protein
MWSHRRMSEMTWGRCGSLLLHRKGLAPSTPCRSPGASQMLSALPPTSRHRPTRRACPLSAISGREQTQQNRSPHGRNLWSGPNEPIVPLGLDLRRPFLSELPRRSLCTWGRLLLLRPNAIFCELSLGGKDAEISAGVMAASVPSAGMILHQTDFAFLPV